MKRNDDFEIRREHLKDLSDAELETRFWELIDEMIKTLEAGGTIEGLNELGQIINAEVGFDATTITEADIEAYGLGE